WAPVLPEVEPVFIDIARAIARRESLLVVCADDAHRDRIEVLLAAASVPTQRLHLVTAPSNDTWARDHGPVTVLADGRPLLLDFLFNGWGNKHPAELDNGIPRALCAAGVFGDIACRPVDLVLEGGALESDGAGTLLTTESCLLNPSRNPGHDRRSLEARLSELLGFDRFLWLSHGALAGDDTDGHIDTLARFCDPGTIAYVKCDDPGDSHYDALAAMEAELREFRDRHGNPYRLVPLPWPGAKYGSEGTRLPATYANFLIVNGAVLLPVYDDAADEAAISQIAACFPERTVIPIHCMPLIQQYGSLHCVTMQFPAGVLKG
ncbi:MAG TPA: agmatine deiminase family protein, partial [Gammaproteobacteria bacterium]|nr:agmatine deiminase family protein [Gammaproteobacteria bacterium]